MHASFFKYHSRKYRLGGHVENLAICQHKHGSFSLFPAQLHSYYIIFLFKCLYLLGFGYLTLVCNDFIILFYLVSLYSCYNQRIIPKIYRPGNRATILGSHSFPLLFHTGVPSVCSHVTISLPQTPCPQYRSFALQDSLVPTLCYLHYRRKCLYCTGNFFLSL